MNRRASVAAGLFGGLILAASPAWAGFCQESLTSGNGNLHLIGESLLVDFEEGEDGIEVTTVVVGLYKLSNGYTVSLDCTHEPGSYVTSGVSV